MCAVSAVFDNYRMNVPPTQWTPDTFTQFQQIIKQLNDLDRKLNQKDCEDPSKANWMKEIEQRLKELEAQ